MRQVEISRTLVLNYPRRARAFFEALVADNIGIGRPEDVSLVFARQPKSPSDRFGTRVVSRGTQVRIDFATSTPASSNTSKTVARSGSRRSSTTPPTSASDAACTTYPSSSSKPGRSTSGCL